MRVFYFSMLFTGIVSGLAGQQVAQNFWKPVAQNEVVLPYSATRVFEPFKYEVFQLDFPAMREALSHAPREFTADALTRKCVIRMPQADGTFEDYEVVAVQTMMSGLAAKFPEITTYGGKSIQSPGKSLRITCSPSRGLEAFVRRADKGSEFVEKLATDQETLYMAYDRRDYPFGPPPGVKNLIDRSALTAQSARPERFTPGEPTIQERGVPSKPVTLKVYRFVLSVTGEFSVDNGGTLASVMAKVVSTTNLLNTIYEADLDIRLELINDEDKVIFLDPATDPFTSNSASYLLGINPTVVFNALGTTDSYDLGHALGRYVSPDPALGIGSLQSCCTMLKARGASTGNIPYGADFFSTIGQEIGHQWGALHTWNHCASITEPFGDTERCEPGSGSTIMSYSGACNTDNVLSNFAQADLYYDVCSIVSIRNYVETGVASTCGTTMATGNNTPVAMIPYPDNFFIPISTPFELNGTVTDPDGESVTVNWDEIDLGPTTPLGTPVANSPLFRSRPATSATNRVFPRISTIINNQFDKTEVLPTYTRDLSFCMVARDGHAGAGGIGIDTVYFHATASAGPFLVTSPDSSNVVWKVGDFQDVTWAVANTDKTLVNCKHVNIRLSTDGGLTYPTTLASGVPNDGRFCVQVPNNVSNTARVRVEAADNVFFDISNANFKIQQPTQPGFGLCVGKSSDHECLPGAYSTPVSTSSLASFSSPITLTATGLPSGATAVFSPNPVQPGSDATMTVTFANGTAEGTYNVSILGTAGTASKSVTLALNIVSNNFDNFKLAQPADGSVGVIQAPVLKWTGVPDADGYDIEIASNPAFDAGSLLSTIAHVANVDSFNVPVILPSGQVVYWRVRPVNGCGPAAWSEPFVFVVSVMNCLTLDANDLPLNISSSGTPTAESKITVISGGPLSDVNIKNITGYHDNFRDLEVHLVGPSATDVLLWKNRCGSSSYSFNLGFDDVAPSTFTCPPANNGAAKKPVSPLAAFNGQNSTGVWTLLVKDNYDANGGQITAFQLELCSNASLNAPFIVNNNVLNVGSGANAGIGSDLLKADKVSTSADQLTYTLITVPKHGELHGNGASIKVGDQFTQADVNNNYLQYYDYGQNTGHDDFRFAVTDGAGGMVAGTFNISSPVGTREPAGAISFRLAPNPADETIRLYFAEPLPVATAVAIYNTAGQVLRRLVIPAGENILELRVDDLPQGVYAVSVQNDRAKGVKKVVIK
jgi:subtilisin-like proprotein convertase family protein